MHPKQHRPASWSRPTANANRDPHDSSFAIFVAASFGVTSFVVPSNTTGHRKCPTTQPQSSSSAPAWFEAFLADRATRKPSAHTMKANRQDFDAIATVIVGDDPVAEMCFE
jgi:hypothetical protein